MVIERVKPSRSQATTQVGLFGTPAFPAMLRGRLLDGRERRPGQRRQSWGRRLASPTTSQGPPQVTVRGRGHSSEGSVGQNHLWLIHPQRWQSGRLLEETERDSRSAAQGSLRGLRFDFARKAAAQEDSDRAQLHDKPKQRAAQSPKGVGDG
ncbi:hypothetical protein HIM_05465 [Hirsutella minnesotensis 3608]|uniref:Uncharacterized protein n=1 Tax=Hirsutella minnesotensis 3608 TaxID=1043627 RepID=A0A0F7ZKI3_9HYPO|nr:hypothetical protein HIM_05465 [Hirsutella minnesotensis 3608]